MKKIFKDETESYFTREMTLNGATEAKNSMYELPSDEKLTLSTKLAAELKKRFRRDRENKFQLYIMSAGLREKHLDQENNAYSNEFTDWFESSGMKEHYGSLSNFTKYAAAGDAIDYVARNTSNPQKYLNQLPVSLRALYQISLIIKLDEEAFIVCLHFTPRRTRIDAPKHEWKTKNTDPLIHPHSSSNDLAAWRKRWESPETEKEEDKYHRNVKLLTVSISEDIFSFDDVGNKTGVVDLEQVQELLAQIQTLFSKSNQRQFKLDTSIDRIVEKYKSEKEKRDPVKVVQTPKKNRSRDYS